MDLIKITKNYYSSSKNNNNVFKSDRILYKYTTLLISFFTCISTFKRFYKSPINCWVHAELRRYENFINRYCWIKGTYYTDPKYESHVLSFDYKKESMLHYYQWVHFYLLLIGLLVYLPKIVWNFVTKKILDYDLFNLVNATRMHADISTDKRHIIRYLSSILIPDQLVSTKYLKKILTKETQNVKNRSNSIGKSLYLSNESTSSIKMSFEKIKKSSLILTYVQIKLLNFLTTCIVFFMLNKFMTSRTNDWFYLFELFKKFSYGESEIASINGSKVFPKIAVCDVKIKEISSIAIEHTYSFDCVLPYNLFNEKVFMILYLWIVFFLIPFTLFDFLNWSKILLYRQSNSNNQFVKDRLKALGILDLKNESFLLQIFNQYYLNPNTIFVLRLLESNSNYVITSEFLNYNWENFKKNFDLF